MKEDEVGGTCGTHGGGERCLQDFGWEGGRKGRPRHMLKDNIKMDLREIVTNGKNWIRLAQDTAQWWAFVSMVMKLRVP
jgi:hypothetical protein